MTRKVIFFLSLSLGVQQKWSFVTLVNAVEEIVRGLIDDVYKAVVTSTQKVADKVNKFVSNTINKGQEVGNNFLAGNLGPSSSSFSFNSIPSSSVPLQTELSSLILLFTFPIVIYLINRY